MATTKITLDTTWQQAATSAQEFMIDNQSSYDVHVTFQSSAPGAGVAYHILKANQVLTRLGLAGNVYVRDASGDSGVAFVVVTV